MSDLDAVLRLNAELSLFNADYWHEIDINGGSKAHTFYVEDAEFHGPHNSYFGRAKIQAFYDWRQSQPKPRLSVHSFTNFRAYFTGEDTAESTCFSMLYADNGVKPMPSNPPVTTSLCTDKYRRVGGKWLLTYKRFEHLFESGMPVTNPDLSDKK